MTDTTTLDAQLLADAEARIRALDLTSFIVEAPAGAGKTELLTQRFLKLLTTVNEPEEIVAITFTNKASAEMRSRILDSLLQAQSGVAPALPHKQKTYALSKAVLTKSAQLNWQLLANPARLRIFTIDGLCAYLARQMPLMSRFGSQPSIADDPSSYYLQAAERTLAEIENEALQPVVMDALRYLDNDAKKLSQLLVSMLEKRDQWLHHASQSISTAALQSTLANVVAEELAAVAEVINLPIQTALMPLARYAAGNLSCEQPIALLNDWHEPLRADANALMMWQAVADLVLTKTGGVRSSITKNQGFPANDNGEKADFKALLMNLVGDERVAKALQRVRLLPSLHDHQDAWQMITTLSQLLKIAAAQLWLVFSQAKEVDFVEVSQKAVDALAGDEDTTTDLALRLDYQIKHLLVDEFQDTSPSQISLLEKITQGWQADDGRTLFLVGDPMQSIYRFRKANVGLFIAVANQGIGDIHLASLRLYRNNRSCPAVVDWINQTFNGIFAPADNTAKGAISYRPFIATKGDEDGQGIVVHPVIKTPEMTSDDGKQLEAEKVVSIILQTRAENPAAKIAILVRAKAHLQKMVSLLRRHHADIPFQAVEIEGLANRQIVQDLLSLTRALYHRADRVSWLATLRAPWCGLSLADLHALAGHDHYSTVWSLMQREDLLLSADGQARLAHVKAIFAEALQAKGRVNISRWVRGVWLMLGGGACLWSESDVVDVQAFFDCVEQLDRNGEFSLPRLASEIDKLYAAPDATGEALQMMTIHKSKGLEFDTVILPSLGASTGGNDDKPMVLWEEVATHQATGEAGSQPVAELLAAPLIPKGKKAASVSAYDYLAALEKERDQNEDARVLYVAATRAVRKLHLVGTANQDKKEALSATKHTYLAMLWPVTGAAFEVASTTPLEANAEATQDSITSFVPKLLRLKTPAIPAALAVDASIERIHPANRAQQAVEIDTLSIESAVGTLTHKYLELMVGQISTWTAASVAKLTAPMKAWFVGAGFSSAVAAEAASQVQALLVTTLQSADGQWVLQAHEKSEAEFAMMHETADGAKGLIVDRTFVTSEDGESVRWIVDYKTKALANDINEAALLSEAAAFSSQLDGYAQLFQSEGLPIQQAIYFVSIGRLIKC